jgi:hypothetical protein
VLTILIPKGGVSRILARPVRPLDHLLLRLVFLSGAVYCTIILIRGIQPMQLCRATSSDSGVSDEVPGAIEVTR